MHKLNAKRHQLEKGDRLKEIKDATIEAQSTLAQIKDYFESGLGKLAESYEKIMEKQIAVATGDTTEINGRDLTPAQVLKAQTDLLKLLPQHRPPSPDEAREKNDDVKDSLAGVLADAKVDIHLHPTTEEVIEIGNDSSSKSVGASLAAAATPSPTDV